MKNQLNSVLLEGTITEIQDHIWTVKNIVLDGKKATSFILVKVSAKTASLRYKMRRYEAIGETVKIVGNLIGTVDNLSVIGADTIFFKSQGE